MINLIFNLNVRGRTSSCLYPLDNFQRCPFDQSMVTIAHACTYATWAQVHIYGHNIKGTLSVFECFVNTKAHEWIHMYILSVPQTKHHTNYLLAAIGCAATSSFNPTVSHCRIIWSRSASSRREPLNPIHGTHARQLVKTKWLLQARHGGSRRKKTNWIHHNTQVNIC